MAAEVLLSSEAFIKATTSISDNLAGKYLLPSLREAQEVGLRGILGDCLLDTLKAMVGDGSINAAENAAYKALVDRAQYYLAYKTVVEVAYKVSYKVVNFGIARTSDENVQAASQDEIAKMQYYYQAKADACCLSLQTWLLDNRAAFPELDECACSRIHANLRSAASCGIWMGGVRGRGPYRRERR